MGMWIIAPAVIVAIVLLPKLLEIIIGFKGPDRQDKVSDSGPTQDDLFE